MATLEERVSILEAKVDGHAGGIGEVRASLRSLDAKLDQRFDALSSHVDALDQKLDRRFDALSSRIDGLDQKLDRRIDGLDQKFSRQFNLLLVFHLTTLSAIVIGFLTR